MALIPLPCMNCLMVFLVSRAWGDSNVRKALLVGCSLQLFQQLIGINTVKFFMAFIIVIYCWQVIYYSARILMMSGISTDMTMILWLSALVSAVNFFASFLGDCPQSHSVLETVLILAGMALIDRLGRRVLCLGSYIGILASLLVIGAGFQLSEYRKLIMKYANQIIDKLVFKHDFQEQHNICWHKICRASTSYEPNIRSMCLLC